MRVIGLPCPHCAYTVRAVKSRMMSAMPKADIRIPMSQHARAAATSPLALDLTAGC